MTDTTGAAPLRGRTALISGSSSGIGAGVALALPRPGAARAALHYPVGSEPTQAEALGP